MEYSNSILQSFRKYQYSHDYEYFEGESEYEGRGFTSRAFNDNSAKRLNKFPKLSEYTRPHFRPTEKSSTSTVATPSPSTSTTSSTTETTTPATSTARESTTKSTSSTTISTNSTNDDTRENTTEEAIALTVTTSHMMKEQNFSINEIPEQIDRIDEDLDEDEEVAEVSEISLDETSTAGSPGITELPSDPEVSEDLLVTPKETTAQEEISGSSEQEFRPRPEYRPAGKPETTNMEGQLYQDVAAKDQQEQPVLKLRGV